MKEDARIKSTIEILALHNASKQPLDQIAHRYFKTNRFIGSKDRQSISAYVYGVMRHRASCDWWALERGLSPLLMGHVEASRIRLIAYLWIFEKIKRETFGILFSGQKYGPEKLSDKECAIFEKLPEHKVKSPWIEGEFPEWLYPFLKRRFRENLTKEMEAFLQQAPLDLRVNTLKATREQALASLKQSRIDVFPSPLSPWGLRCEGRVNITQTKTFQNGLIEVQDEGSQLIVKIMDVQSGQSVLDLCAGAGGKTLALAALLENKGRVVATDTAEWRLKRAKERLKRAGAFNVELKGLAGLNDKWLKRQTERFDRVLIDAPCSGSGTWRRNPDQKWNLTPQDIKELSALQKDLLEVAAPTVKRGGYLIYATCSLLWEENQDIATSFLETNPAFTLIPCGLDGGDFLTLSPLQNGTDGFFAAKFQRPRE